MRRRSAWAEAMQDVDPWTRVLVAPFVVAMWLAYAVLGCDADDEGHTR